MPDMIKPLPHLRKQYRVCPVRFGPDPQNPNDTTPADAITFLHEEQLPQPFAELDQAVDAGKAIIGVTGGHYVVMQVEQKFVAASFLFDLVEPLDLRGGATEQ
jgi:hypothetical protein